MEKAPLDNDYDALVSALMLGITASTEGKARESIKMAIFFASFLTDAEVETAKVEAKLKIEMNNKD